MSTFRAKVWRLGDDIDTDIIIPTDYLALKTIEDMKQYAFSPLRPELAGQITAGDVIVAGKNFGCGSSREQAPEIIKACGIRCVIAKSFARIFFRNAINNGLLLIEQPDLYDHVEEGEEIEVRVNEKILAGGCEYPITSLPENLMNILNAGGLVKAMRRQNGLDAVMRAVYIKAPFQFDIREVPIPEPDADQVLIDVRACAVCGTDMHTAAADAQDFQSFGHEIAGVVVKTGKNVIRFRPGEKVVLESGTFCHTCDNCRNGRIDLCTNGISMIDDVEISGYADYLVAPQQALIPFEGLEFEEAALAEPLGVAMDLFYTTGIDLNDDVIVYGLGPIGLMAIALAKAAGARNVYAVQRNGNSKARIDLARKLGVTDVILTSETDITKYVFPRGGVDKIMVTASPSVLPAAFELANYGGIIGFLGIASGEAPMVSFDANRFHFKKLQLRASYAVPALWFPRALELLKQKVIDPADYITQTFSLNEIETYFKKQKEDISDVIKMVMVKNG